ncbi:hypothetical protein HDU99_004416 [Rhizoclosmatium hyalinum]|nr:hypothetical protein HDU99_004416 [Rhizoclosmatium hyalinum]
MISSGQTSLTPTQVIRDGRRIIHAIFSDGTEQIEEFDATTEVLLVRKLRKKSVLGKEGPWHYEVGEEPAKEAHAKKFMDEISEAVGAPQVSRRDTLKAFVFRIRNLPYDISVYNVTTEGSQIVVRTTNKKYFTRLSITDLDRINYKSLQQSSLSIEHQAETLIITYLKPAEILEKERKERDERKKQQQAEATKSAASSSEKVNKINDECKTQ